MEQERCIAERLFEGASAEFDLEECMEVAGIPFTGPLRWDSYDCSIEFDDVPQDYRLSIEAQKAIHGAGFAKAYMNHADKWETHYSFKPREEFAESKGWRVSYPHKRGDNQPGIWVEEAPQSWPKEWVETGYVLVKPATTLHVGGQ